jgi:hypothetical protein
LNIIRKTHSILIHTVTLFLALEKDFHPITIKVFVGEQIYKTYISFERGYSDFKIIALAHLFLQPQFSPYVEYTQFKFLSEAFRCVDMDMSNGWGVCKI